MQIPGLLDVNPLRRRRALEEARKNDVLLLLSLNRTFLLDDCKHLVRSCVLD